MIELTTLLQNEMTARAEMIGFDVVATHYEAVYSESFKASTVRLCDYLNGLCDSQEDYYTEYNEICAGFQDDKINSLYQDWLIKNDQPDHEGSYSIFEERFHQVISDIHNYMLISETALICYIVNYKGEGEGWRLADDCSGLRMYQGKHEAFNF